MIFVSVKENKKFLNTLRNINSINEKKCLKKQRLEEFT
jgi:hypothetical protein